MLTATLVAALSLTWQPLSRDKAPPDVLAGPKVAAPAAGPGIIERGFDGLVKPAEPTPEEATLALLTLSDEEAAKTREIVTRRSKLLDEFMSNNIPLLTQFGVAEGASNKKEQMALAYHAMVKLKPVRDLGPLQNQLAAVLTPGNKARFESILKDYWDAYVKDRRAIKKPDGKYPGRFEIMAGAKFESLAKEGERAFKGMLDSGDLVYQYLFKDMTLRPAQSEKIRTLLADFMRRTKGEAGDKENGELFLIILPILDDAQRKQFAANIRTLSGAEKPKTAKAKAKKPPVP